MNSPIFHEIFNAIVAKINDLRPKVSIFFKEINAKLDAKGKYTKKIVWSFVGLVTFWTFCYILIIIILNVTFESYGIFAYDKKQTIRPEKS